MPIIPEDIKKRTKTHQHRNRIKRTLRKNKFLVPPNIKIFKQAEKDARQLANNINNDPLDLDEIVYPIRPLWDH